MIYTYFFSEEKREILIFINHCDKNVSKEIYKEIVYGDTSQVFKFYEKLVKLCKRFYSIGVCLRLFFFNIQKETTHTDVYMVLFSITFKKVIK